MIGRFIISTGRSGSTLLSTMLAQNSHVLVLSEFIAAMDNHDRFQAGIVSGNDFAAILTSDDGLSALIADRGRPSAEVLNHGGQSSKTFTGRAPALFRSTLPPLTDDPQALYDEMISFVSRQSAQDIGGHYRALFEWMCDRLGKRAWVERSGFGIRVFPGLRQSFPDARYFHIHRDGIEAALSMRAHPYFRVAAWFDANPPTIDEARSAILRDVPDDVDCISRHHASPPPVEIYGMHWSNLLCRAYRELAHIDRSQYRELSFEDLVLNVKTELDALADFFDLPADEGWTARAAALVDGNLRPRGNTLSADELARLEAACLPGQILLGRANPGQMDRALLTLREAYLSLRN